MGLFLVVLMLTGRDTLLLPFKRLRKASAHE
jgi:hypothetical protein